MSDPSLHAPVAALPPAPVGWTFFCRERELSRGPVAVEFLNRRLVAFRTDSGRVGILDSRCQHLGADLSKGKVIGECVECPFHGWQYGADGVCRKIPQADVIPDFARQKSYPGQVRNGLLFMWNGPRPLYPLPFYEGLDPEEMICAGPKIFDLACPWYMVGANSFDVQHLSAVHERVLLEPPQVSSPTEFAMASRSVAKVGSKSRYDRFVRSVSGPVATMTATNWSGSLVFVRVELERATTFGMVSLRPLSDERVLAHIFAFLPRSRSKLLGLAFDSLRAALRLYLIGQFLKDDAKCLNGIRAGSLNLISADQELAGYFQWLSKTANGIPAAPRTTSVATQVGTQTFHEGART